MVVLRGLRPLENGERQVRVSAVAARVRAAWRVSWSVGAACMRPAAVYPTNPFFGCDRVWSMRRGGIDAARRNGAALPVAGVAGRLPCIVGRGLGPAAPIQFSKCSMCGGNGQPTGNPARGKRPRAACMRPLRTGRERQVSGQSRRLPQTGSAGVNARPTKQDKRQQARKRVLAAFYHTANQIFSRQRRASSPR